MPKIKLVTDVSQYGLFRSLAESRLRLVFATAAALVGTYLAGLWAAEYIFDASSSVILNLVIITAMMMLLLVGSYLLTVLVGDLFFPGPWREQVILGETPPSAEITVEDHSAEFMIVLILAVVANALALNWAADDFLDRYHNEGFYQVRLRADAPGERLDALEDIADPMNYEIWELDGVQQTVLDVFDDPESKVRERAYWTAGHIEIDGATDELIEVVDSDAAPPEKAAAAVAIGKLGGGERARAELETLAAASAETDARIGALRGLGLLEADESVAVLVELLDADDDRIFTHALWALREIGSKEARPHVRQIIDEEKPQGVRRCAAFDALKAVATEEDMTWARRQFQRTEDDQEACEHIIWTDEDGQQYYIVYGDSFSEKLMKIVANTAAHQYEDWFQRLVNDPDQSWRIREVADQVLREIKESRGD